MTTPLVAHILLMASSLVAGSRWLNSMQASSALAGAGAAGHGAAAPLHVVGEELAAILGLEVALRGLKQSRRLAERMEAAG